MLLSRLPRLRDPAVDPREAFAGTFHVNESATPARGRLRAGARAGACPSCAPCEIYCHSLTDPSILGPELRDAGAQTLTCFGLHMPARLFAGDPAGGQGGGDRGDAALARQRARPSRSRTACASTPAGEPCLEARTPLELEAELGLPGGNIFHRDLAWPFAEDEGEVGTWGVETRARERAAVRRGRAPRRRRQRHPRPQRRDEGALI